MKPEESSKRKFVLIGIVVAIFLIYIIQLFHLQLLNPDYEEWANSNAFLKKTRYPSRGIIYDRNDKLLVYNQPSYDLMVVVKEMDQTFDTLSFCQALNITPEVFRNKMKDIRNRRINPGYSPYSPQIFATQLGLQEYGLIQEASYKFPGFYVQNRTTRKYDYPNAAHVLGYMAETDKQNLADDDYYSRGDFLGKTGIEKYYEKQLRGKKGVEILLRDAVGKIKGKYEDGRHDEDPVSGKDLKLSIDIDLQAYGEELMQNKRGAIVMIEPSTGEILCLVSAPTYDPSSLVGRQYSSSYLDLVKHPEKPLNNRALLGYPPGSTFKMAQGLVFLEEGIVTPHTAYSCYNGFPVGRGRPACHPHGSPLPFVPAIATSCNSYFCWGLKAMLENRKYGSIQNAMDTWRDYMVSQGFGYALGLDLPDEKRGLIPNSKFYGKWYHDKNGNPTWNAMSVISISIGQGEILLTPIQICNMSATIANRGFFHTPHVVKEIKGTPMDTLYTKRRYTDISSRYYDLAAEGMRMAVTGGTCRGANIPGMDVCGKTGTAENKGKDHSIFTGFAPLNDAKVAIMVFVENGGYGATYAVPIGRLMMEKYLLGEVPESSKGTETYIKNTKIL